MATPSATDAALFGIATFAGTFGYSIAGFGMALIYLFVWQMAALAGWNADVKLALVIQALGLLVVQPKTMAQAKPWKHAERRLMALVLPVIVLTSLLGKMVADRVDTTTIKAVAGIVVLLLSLFEASRLIAECVRARMEAKEAWRANLDYGTGGDSKGSAGNVRPSVVSGGSGFSGQTKTSKHERAGTISFDEKVFFMIGCQRSGSNWLRTMLGERDDLDNPHPPHIMDTFLPKLGKFGDLRDEAKLKILLSHICAFTERNQVPWTDLHGRKFRIDRQRAFELVMSELDRLEAETRLGEEEFGKMCMLAIFDTIYGMRAKANQKATWICKSMGMSKYHNLLMKYYGEDRLRYIYLVRDPRDVAMSFMKTPVGDCHYYAIAKKWCQLQDFAAKVIEAKPKLVFTIRYEELLKDLTGATERLHEFLGPHRFAKVDSTKSLVARTSVMRLVTRSSAGREAKVAAGLSTQFQNLNKGEDFRKNQLQKWLNGPEPLAHEDLLLIESVAHKTMKMLDYETHLVEKTEKPMNFTPELLAEYDNINKAAIKKMNDDLWQTDVEDARRREFQGEILTMPAELIPEAAWEDGENTGGRPPSHTAKNVADAVSNGTTCNVTLSHGFSLRIASVCMKGYYPRSPPPNQDAICTVFNLGGRSEAHLLGVFDGNGPNGELCSGAAAKKIPELLAQVKPGVAIETSLESAWEETNRSVIEDDAVHALSASTSVCAFFEGRTLHVCHTGDSPCILGEQLEDGSISTDELTPGHTPHRRDELRRVKAAGARVMTMNQIEGEEPAHEKWRSADVPRLWSKTDKRPGVAVTRAIGGREGQAIGVIATPEIMTKQLRTSDKVLVLCSDGVTDQLTPEEVIKMASNEKQPQDACLALLDASVERWSQAKDRIDDISVIVCFIDRDPAAAEADDDEVADNRPDRSMMYVGDADDDGYARKSGAGKNPAQGAAPTGWLYWFAAWAMASASGFLGGLCAIPGPPVILFFLHWPRPKEQQKANGVTITGLNCIVRIAYDVVAVVSGDGSSYAASEWPLYVAVALAAIVGADLGAAAFSYVKNAQFVIKSVLTLMLVLNGVTMTVGAFYQE